MKTKKFLACLLAGTMALSLVACGGDADTDSSATTPESTVTADVSTPVEASIDFEDGNMGFLAPYMVPANAADVELSIVDFNDSKALAVKNLNEKVPYIGIDATSLLGDKIEKVASIEMTLGVSYADGTFSAVSGELYAWSGADLIESEDVWAVYLEKANPKVATGTLSAGEEFVVGAGNILILSLSTDVGLSEGKGAATFYVDNIRFLDAAGNLLDADTTVAFVAPEGFENTGKDMSNLCAVSGAVNWEGFAVTGGGWAQNGVAFTDEVKAALVPGSVIEIEYSSTTGNMWIVMNEAESGWARVGVGNVDGSGSTASYMNNSKNIAQVTYEQIASICGDDVATWGNGLQCESDGDWEVFSVKVGQAAPVYTLAGAVDWEGFAVTGGAWSQNGIAFTDDIKAALVPGSVIEVTYSSTTDNMWLVLNEAEAGWSRVGVGNADGSGSVASVCYDGKCYVTYEMIEAICGDVSTWGNGLQCESDGDWEVYGVRVGTANTMKMVNNVVNWEGFAVTGGAWSQNGVAFTEEVKAALVPGSVLNITYTSDTGNLWVVMNEAEVGWTRVGVGTIDGGSTGIFAACNNGICQVTYEQIEALCGDVATWGSGLQCESDGNWEVFSVTVGQAPVTE